MLSELKNQDSNLKFEFIVLDFTQFRAELSGGELVLTHVIDLPRAEFGEFGSRSN